MPLSCPNLRKFGGSRSPSCLHTNWSKPIDFLFCSSRPCIMQNSAGRYYNQHISHRADTPDFLVAFQSHILPPLWTSSISWSRRLSAGRMNQNKTNTLRYRNRGLLLIPRSMAVHVDPLRSATEEKLQEPCKVWKDTHPLLASAIQPF